MRNYSIRIPYCIVLYCIILLATLLLIIVWFSIVLAWLRHSFLKKTITIIYKYIYIYLIPLSSFSDWYHWLLSSFSALYFLKINCNKTILPLTIFYWNNPLNNSKKKNGIPTTNFQVNPSIRKNRLIPKEHSLHIPNGLIYGPIQTS